ncbi:MAG: NosD domain-containing protein [Asticcacaulis sp.]|uniref:NosD domain-containing protein n=1 Tax=Asticcacaulis sp. TaxID=1872648 RepID=UPI0039E54E9D
MKTLLITTALAVFAMPALAQSPAFAPKTTLAVTSAADDGSAGTLRWAIEQNNLNPGQYRIALSSGLGVIKPGHELPPILGPVIIEGTDYAKTGAYAVIDGSAYVIGDGARACPGAVPGQYGTNVRTTTNPGLILRDTHGVEIHGIEVRNFCIGILINRASDNDISDNRIVGNKGGAGIMLTGDDGKGNSTATTTNHNKILRNTFLNNGDAMEATRGAAFNLIADNIVTSDASNAEPSQGLEILWGNDNIVVRNHFEGLSDGVQLNWGNRNYIGANYFTNLSSAVTLSGTDNIVDGNIMTGNRVAVSVRPQVPANADGTPARNRVSGPAVNLITANSMYANGKDIKRCFAGGACLPDQKGAIVLGVPGLEHASFIGNRGGGVESDPSKLEQICSATITENCEAMPNHNLKAPTLTAVSRIKGEVAVSGTVTGPADSLARVELFGNATKGEDEAETYLGFVMVPLDSQGQGTFVFRNASPSARKALTFTATLTSSDRATSPLSRPAT